MNSCRCEGKARGGGGVWCVVCRLKSGRFGGFFRKEGMSACLDSLFIACGMCILLHVYHICICISVSVYLYTCMSTRNQTCMTLGSEIESSIPISLSYYSTAHTCHSSHAHSFNRSFHIHPFTHSVNSPPPFSSPKSKPYSQ